MNLLVPTSTRVVPDLAAALELKCFIGQPRANGFAADHPLGRGFRAIRKFMTSGRLLTAEWRTAVDLNLSAESILRGLRGSVPDYKLLSDLCNAERCRALLFEAHVAEFVLRPSVGVLGWRRYAPARSDFLTKAPAIQVECKLVTKRASVQRVMEKAFERVYQRTEGEAPFVLVAGCDELIDSEDIQRLPEKIGRTAGEWFARHPEVAAVVAVFPEATEPVKPSARLYRTSDLQFRNGSVVTLLNKASTAPLPAGFEFATRGN